jgi:hypothetical protein
MKFGQEMAHFLALLKMGLHRLLIKMMRMDILLFCHFMFGVFLEITFC